ncbi:MAG: class I SAM-dependent methyltransferase [Planctomycetota bacterium]
MDGTKIATLPLGATLLQARHLAHDQELRRLVDTLPLQEGEQAIDVPCGDGFFTQCLAERVGQTGTVAAVDLEPSVIRRGRAHQVGAGPAPRVRFCEADASALPFSDDSFDLAWCAHSLVSLPNAMAALREMRRVVRPGGFVAVLGNDILHEVLLPWPPRLELALGRAERKACRRSGRNPRRLHVSRWLNELVDHCGLELVDRRTCPIDRRAPLSPNDEQFVTLHLKAVTRRVGDLLAAPYRRLLERLADPRSPGHMLRQRHFAMTCLDVLTLARVPLASLHRLEET